MKKNPGIYTAMYPEQVSSYMWVWSHVKVQSKLWNVEITAILAMKVRKKIFGCISLGKKCGKVKVEGSKESSPRDEK